MRIVPSSAPLLAISLSLASLACDEPSPGAVALTPQGPPTLVCQSQRTNQQFTFFLNVADGERLVAVEPGDCSAPLVSTLDVDDPAVGGFGPVDARLTASVGVAEGQTLTARVEADLVTLPAGARRTFQSVGASLMIDVPLGPGGSAEPRLVSLALAGATSGLDIRTGRIHLDASSARPGGFSVEYSVRPGAEPLIVPLTPGRYPLALDIGLDGTGQRGVVSGDFALGIAEVFAVAP